jgi:hypothetical protein
VVANKNMEANRIRPRVCGGVESCACGAAATYALVCCATFARQMESAAPPSVLHSVVCCA